MLAGVNVTFLHLACSGALASEGILQPYMGIEPSDDDLPPLPHRSIRPRSTSITRPTLPVRSATPT